MALGEAEITKFLIAKKMYYDSGATSGTFDFRPRRHPKRRSSPAIFGIANGRTPRTNYSPRIVHYSAKHARARARKRAEPIFAPVNLPIDNEINGLFGFGSMTIVSRIDLIGLHVLLAMSEACTFHRSRKPDISLSLAGQRPSLRTPRKAIRLIPLAW